MLRNYVTVALRAMIRRWGYSTLNIAGLAVGMACCLVIFQYVSFEYSFDRFHEHERDIYRVLQTTPLTGEPFDGGGPFTGFALAPALADDVPEILHVARLHPAYGSAVVTSPERPDRVFEEDRVFYADPAFLEMFTFPIVAGDAEGGLKPGTVLISESVAQKYFGMANPMGKVLDVRGSIDRPYRVTGLFRDTPANSHLQFDFLLPMEDLIREGYADEPEGGWSFNNFFTYVQLRPGADPAAAEVKMTNVYRARRGDVLREQGRTARVFTQPLRDVHLNAAFFSPDMFVMSSYRTVYFFTVIGLVTLLIALVNYVNLATARSLDRAREVGVRKVVGAQRKQLVLQFLLEAALTNVIAAVLAVLLAVLLTPIVNDLAETQLTGGGWVNPWFWAAILVTFGIGTVLAGLYPAFVLSSFKPVAVLKGKAGALSARLWLRRGLVVLQFAASVVLIVGTVIVHEQLGYMRQMDLGMDLEQVLVVDGPRVLSEGIEQETAMNTFAEELRRLPAVQGVAKSTTLPGEGFNWNGASFRRAISDPSNTLSGVVTYIDTSFADLYGLELLAGREFADITVSDSQDVPWQVIANETAVRALGFSAPEDAVGQAVYIGDYDALIAGVYRDFNWTSAHDARQNIFFGRTNGGRRVSLRVSTDDLPATIATVQSVYDRLFPGNVFRYDFADEQFNRQYRRDQRFANLFSLFAGLAIVIACLGLVGLAAFTAAQRTKEIGVRKVLGASVGGVVGLLSRDFLQLVGIAFVLAVPVAYFLMSRWLSDFAYHTDLGPGVFILSGALVLLIAATTVGYQAIKAAMADPVKSLRLE